VSFGRPITATIDLVADPVIRGIAQVVVAPRADAVYEGQQLGVQAYALDAFGMRVSVDPSLVHWSVLDPRGGRMMVASGSTSAFLAVNSQFPQTVFANIGNLSGGINSRTIPDPFIDVSVGGDHSCALRQSGALYCWGDNLSGQVGVTPVSCGGISTQYCQTRPTLVSGGRLWSSVSSGRSHTCGIDRNRQGFCWGNSGDDRLGSSSAAFGGLPNSSPLVVDGGRSYDVISAGVSHSCAIESGTGAAFCWGWQYQGALGDGHPTGLGSQPTPVLGGHTFQQINAANSFTCAVDGNQATWCWGVNNNHELGHTSTWLNNTGASHDTVPVLTDNTLLASSLSKGFGQTTCFVSVSGSPFCWGMNDESETGTGLPDPTVAVPTLMSGNPSFTMLTAGDDHTCGIDGGALYCWGTNSAGQLGDGTTALRTLPTPVAIQARFTRISAGGQNTCAVAAYGTVYCWGAGGHGLLGNGTMNTNSAVPVKIAP